MGDISEQSISKIGEILKDETKPLKQRFRALFTLRNIGGEKSIECIKQCFNDPSALLKHELAYCLGQMGDTRALPILTQVLQDKTQEAMVRHEAGEAIGAIGSELCIDILKNFISDPVQEVAETCQLALKRILWVTENGGKTNSPYNSVDPTPPASLSNVEELKAVLTDQDKDLFTRYEAMFALRNINTEESVKALCEGLFIGSALFKHEIAFVLGQLQNESSVPSLIEVLKNTSESEMVRHECAEALGSIATKECMDILCVYQNDPSRVVRESCDIALDMAEYEISNEFQYANSAIEVSVN